MYIMPFENTWYILQHSTIITLCNYADLFLIPPTIHSITETNTTKSFGRRDVYFRTVCLVCHAGKIVFIELYVRFLRHAIAFPVQTMIHMKFYVFNWMSSKV